MCLSPIMIRNKSKYFNLSSLHKIDMQVPCGKCAECMAAKQNEYYFRSYYQSIETWDKGGYCLFDTLTYDDDHVPHINDFIEKYDYKFDDVDNFTCFNYVDVREFFVRLRRSLSYHEFDVKNKLKYFLCSEYGTDPRYTHRPHYHVMFYVTDMSLDPITLSVYIDKCWQNGMTDGVKYKGSTYVLQKRVFYKGADDLHMQNVCHYIGKYMAKDSEFVDTVNKRLEVLDRWIRIKQNNELWDSSSNLLTFESNMKDIMSIKLTEQNKKYLKDLKRHVSQFTRQSQGFGAYMIDKLGKDWIFEHNCVRMPDQQNVWKEIPIPGYIMCKLFKEKKIDANGESYVGWSDYGNKFREYHSFESLENRKRKILETFDFDNLKVHGYKDDTIYSMYEKIDEYMAGRSIDDLLFYEEYMKGRIYVPEMDEVPDFESFKYVDQRECYDGHEISRDDLFDSNDDEMRFLIEEYMYKDEKFDKMLVLYRKVLMHNGKFKQAVYEAKKKMEDRLKNDFKFKVKY